MPFGTVTASYVSATERFVADFQLMLPVADAIIRGNFAPSGCKSPADVVMVLMTGTELGLSHAQALRSMYMISGKPVVASDALAGAIQKHCERFGGYIRVIEQTNERCTVEFMRHNDPEPRQLSWTIDDAKRAGLLVKDNWKNYPADMLKARAIARAARTGWPDVLGGVYDPDEITAVAHPETRPVRTTSSVSVSQPEPITPAAIEAPAEPKASDGDPITQDALVKIREKAAERGVVDLEFDHLVWHRFEGLGSPTGLTVAQGRDLFRWLRDVTEDDLSQAMWEVTKAVNAWLDQQAAMEESAREQQVAQAK
jgi:hypothetical protein